jgi:hypothetical protein
MQPEQLPTKSSCSSFGLGKNVKRKFFHVFVACLLASAATHVAYSQNKSAAVEVPFTFAHSSVIVQVKVNGKRLCM